MFNFISLFLAKINFECRHQERIPQNTASQGYIVTKLTKLIIIE